MTEPSPSLDPQELVDDLPRILRAMNEAVREALWRHKVAGHPVAVWRNERVEWVAPEDITLPEDAALPDLE